MCVGRSAVVGAAQAGPSNCAGWDDRREAVDSWLEEGAAGWGGELGGVSERQLGLLLGHGNEGVDRFNGIRVSCCEGLAVVKSAGFSTGQTGAAFGAGRGNQGRGAFSTGGWGCWVCAAENSGERCCCCCCEGSLGACDGDVTRCDANNTGCCPCVHPRPAQAAARWV